MKIQRAKNAGFCMGVGLALRGLDRELTAQGHVMRENDRFVGAEHHEKHPPLDGRERRIVTLGPIIHNRQVTDFYASKGVVILDSPDGIEPGDVVIVRAHGIPRTLEERLLAMEKTHDIRLVDCTCPKVKKAQLAIAEHSAAGARLLLFGDENHPEVRGLVSYANADPAPVLFTSLEMMRERVGACEGPVFLAAQTTQDGGVYEEMAAWLRERFPDAPVARTICNATRLRLAEARELAGEVEAMIVVGSPHSANSRRVAGAAQDAGAAVFFVDTAADLDREALKGFARVGLTGGSSAPVCLIDAVEERLGEWFGKEGA